MFRGWIRCGLVIIGLALSACDNATPEEHLERARGFLAKDDTSSAVIELKNALQKNADFAPARLILGQTYLTLGDPASALKELERALDLGVDRAQVIPDLLRAKLELGRTAEVLGEIDEVGAATPRLLVLKGQALLRSGDVIRARRAFEDAMAADPAEGVAYLGLAQIGVIENDTAGVEKWLTHGLKAAPRERRLWLAKGDVEASSGRLDDALESFDQASRLPSGDFLAEIGKVRAHLLAKNPEKAEPIVDEVLRKAPKWPIANYLKATIAFERGDLSNAEAALLTVLQVAPGYPPALLLMGTIKFKDKQYAQATAQLKQYLAVDSGNVSARKILAAARLAENDASGVVAALAPVADGLSDAEALTMLGNAQMRLGDAGAATATLERAARVAPDAANVRTQLALSLMASGETEGAIAELRTAIDLDSEMTQSEALLALIQLREGKVEEARATAQEMIRKHPEQPLGYNLLGATELATKNTPAAKASFQRALEADPKFSAAVVNLANIAISEGKPDEARARLSAFLEVDPDSEPGLLGLAQLALAANDLAGASELLQRARTRSATALAPRLALARIALATGDGSLADAVTNEAAEIAPNNPDAVQLRAQADLLQRGRAAAVANVNKLSGLLEPNAPGDRWLVLATLQAAVGQLDKAQRSYEEAVARLPDPIPARVGLLRLALQRGDVAAANVQFEMVRAAKVPVTLLDELEGDIALGSKDPDAAVAAYGRAVAAGSRDAMFKFQGVELARGKTDVALATIGKWLEAHPDDVQAKLALGSVHLVRGDNKSALATYEALEQLAPGNAVALNNLAWLYHLAGDPRAEAVARRALDAAPENPEVADTLGWILVQRDNPSEAVPLLERAAAVRSDSASVQYHLAVAYVGQQRFREARRTLDRALALGEFPERAEAQSLRDRLDAENKP